MRLATQANSQHQPWPTAPFPKSRPRTTRCSRSPWVAEKRERCTESGIVMEEFEESEDDEDPNKPGPVEAYAFRACGKACGTCE